MDKTHSSIGILAILFRQYPTDQTMRMLASSSIGLAAAALLLLSPAAVQLASAAPEEDRIASLPSFGVPPTPQYSGYLDATDGCDTAANGDECKIHVRGANCVPVMLCHVPSGLSSFNSTYCISST